MEEEVPQGSLEEVEGVEVEVYQRPRLEGVVVVEAEAEAMMKCSVCRASAAAAAAEVVVVVVAEGGTGQVRLLGHS